MKYLKSGIYLVLNYTKSRIVFAKVKFLHILLAN